MGCLLLAVDTRAEIVLEISSVLVPGRSSTETHPERTLDLSLLW